MYGIYDNYIMPIKLFETIRDTMSERPLNREIYVSIKKLRSNFGHINGCMCESCYHGFMLFKKGFEKGM